MKQAPTDQALRDAAEINAPSAVTLWPAASPHGRMGALVTAAMYHHTDLFGRLVDLIPTHPLGPANAAWAFTVALQNKMPVEPLRRLLPWVDQCSDLLRTAVQHDHGDAIRLLLPLADPLVARKKWLAGRPTRWDWISRLVSYLPQEQQLEWAKAYPGRIGAAQAAERSHQALSQSPLPSSRRRLRS